MNKKHKTMNYKDKTFEIDNNQIKFKNGIFVVFLPSFIAIFTSSLMFSKGNFLITAISSFLGLITAFFIIRLFIGFYFKNTIKLSDIEYVKAQIWDISIDKNRDFWGTGRYKYHFPTGLNKKTNPKVIFVHIKDRKAAVGFVPENCENTISVLSEREVKVIEISS